MKRSYKYIWGALTVAPILMVIVSIGCFILFIAAMIPEKGGSSTPDMSGSAIAGMVGFYGLLMLGMFLGFLIHISYLIHLVRNETLTKDMKTLWVVLFTVLNILAMIVYWFMVVLPEPEPGSPRLGSVKRIRKR